MTYIDLSSSFLELKELLFLNKKVYLFEGFFDVYFFYKNDDIIFFSNGEEIMIQLDTNNAHLYSIHEIFIKNLSFISSEFFFIVEFMLYKIVLDNYYIYFLEEKTNVVFKKMKIHETTFFKIKEISEKLLLIIGDKIDNRQVLYLENKQVTDILNFEIILNQIIFKENIF
jgi:hypothetical protein